MIPIIDSGGANIASVIFALERLGIKGVLTSDPQIIKSASRVILPGVGAAKEAMKKLESVGLIDCIRSLTQPVLGICLGMQLLFSYSEEGDVGLLNIIPGQVKRLPEAENLPVPHMGWNRLNISRKDDPLTQNLPGETYCYFVHSYAAPVSDFTLASCNYSADFTAIIRKDNFMGCQFHPERSSNAGQKILENFVRMTS
jgi:glutamine amidotransferase